MGVNLSIEGALRKSDNNRIAKACGAVIVNRPDELQESDVGTGAGLFEVKKIGNVCGQKHADRKSVV